MLVLINEVNLCWGPLALGWVTVFAFNFQCTGSVLVCNQPPRSTQPGHPFACRCNECQPKGAE